MENNAPLDNQIQPKNLPLKKIIIAILILAIAGFLFWLFGGKTATGQAQLAWNANTEADLEGYNIYYGTSKRTGDCPPGGYPKKIDAGDNTSFTVTNLTNGATYYFSLTSYDQSGNESCFSPELSKTIPKASWIKSLLNLFSK